MATKTKKVERLNPTPHRRTSIGSSSNKRVTNKRASPRKRSRGQG